MKRQLLLFVLTLILFLTVACSWQKGEVRIRYPATVNKKYPGYVVGMGIGSANDEELAMKEARREATDELASQLISTVRSKWVEETKQIDSSISRYVSSLSAVETNVIVEHAYILDRKISEEGNLYRVTIVCGMKEEEFNDYFKNRKKEREEELKEIKQGFDKVKAEGYSVTIVPIEAEQNPIATVVSRQIESDLAIFGLRRKTNSSFNVRAKVKANMSVYEKAQMATGEVLSKLYELTLFLNGVEVEVNGEPLLFELQYKKTVFYDKKDDFMDSLSTLSKELSGELMKDIGERLYRSSM